MFIQLLVVAILEFLYCTKVFAVVQVPPISGKINQVIYITLDGVRWQDVYQTHQHFPKFWQKHAGKFILYGNPASNTPMYTASVPISLPSYQSQMAGAVQPCAGNECGRIKVETLPEKIIRQLHVPKKKVAIFSSWPEIGYAVEHVAGTTFSNNGNEFVYDPDNLKPDDVMKELNQKQLKDHPEGKDRYDSYTFAQAWHYFVTYKPLFLWISLDNSDGTAHANDLKGYHKALSYYDEMLDEILSYLQTQGLDKQTLVIVTTDHGRGDGNNWINHGPRYPESRKIWAFVMNGELVPVAQDEEKGHYSLLSIRPTIEKALGLADQ
ncbi:alkaline phosphatase family protein [Legionella resiliens]|uniref:Alkaline phosphatase family protein n=1 Tax=Legionella resiliens TaxID=2905958 RepID=A0ABS8X986_9GAMM|nr:MULTISPECIES: alkaline phosphatase family protein [unclassified Legionella]MCE0724381.1 alkaline phosphatase family protein [Legionella sp. 9fVS26]MCE3533533.1 alkaline phosphatase family protein [Legionella sp. 8cVS16]